METGRARRSIAAIKEGQNRLTALVEMAAKHHKLRRGDITSRRRDVALCEPQFSGVGNFSGVPGETNLLLRNVNTGGLEVYNINNNQLTGAAFLGTIGLDWRFFDVAPSLPLALIPLHTSMF